MCKTGVIYTKHFETQYVCIYPLLSNRHVVLSLGIAGFQVSCVVTVQSVSAETDHRNGHSRVSAEIFG